MTTAGLVLAGAMMAVYGLAAFTGAGGVAGFQVFAFGLSHTSLGQAQLILDKNGNLFVGNLRSIGADGVAVDLGQAEGLEVNLIGKLTGFSLQVAVAGEVNGLPNQDIGYIQMPMHPEAGYIIDPNFSPIGVTNYTTEVYSNGELVYMQVQEGTTAIVGQRPRGLRGFLDQAQGGVAGNDVAHSLIWDLDFAIATSIQIVEGPRLKGDRLRLITPPDPVLVGYIDGFYITGEDFELTIGGEQLVQFSNPHEALGQAHIIGSDPGKNQPLQLIVSNIGCCGADGVSIDVGEFTPPDPVTPIAAVHLLIPNVPAEGAYVEAAATVMGVEPSPFLVGSSWASNVPNAPTHVEVSADFTPIGAETYTVQLYNLGRLVAEVMGVNAPVVINNTNVNVSIIGHIAAHAHGQFDWGLTSVQMVTIPGHPPDPVNEIRLIAEVPGGVARGPEPDLVQIDLTAAGIGSFTITDETVGEISFSTADISGPDGPGFPDGCVDAFDLGTLLGAWCSAAGDPDPPKDEDPPCEGCTSPNFALADLAGPRGGPDGCVDAFDLGALLADWCSVDGGNPCGTCGP